MEATYHLGSASFLPQSFSVWYEQGMKATTNDTSPISGLTAQCTPGKGSPGASVEVSSAWPLTC